jgi:hypothetical protein
MCTQVAGPQAQPARRPFARGLAVLADADRISNAPTAIAIAKNVRMVSPD